MKHHETLTNDEHLLKYDVILVYVEEAENGKHMCNICKFVNGD